MADLASRAQEDCPDLRVLQEGPEFRELEIQGLMGFQASRDCPDFPAIKDFRVRTALPDCKASQVFRVRLEWENRDRTGSLATRAYPD